MCFISENNFALKFETLFVLSKLYNVFAVEELKHEM